MTHVSGNHIGRFMIAVGAIIEHESTGNLLLIKRASEFLTGTWEPVYGRIDQYEELEEGLRREVKEEVGITNLEIKRLVRVWHIFRGERVAHQEVYGFTFHCIVKDTTVTISDEHSAFEWVPPQLALERITASGIRKDLEFFIANVNDPKIAVSDVQGNNHFIF